MILRPCSMTVEPNQSGLLLEIGFDTGELFSLREPGRSTGYLTTAATRQSGHCKARLGFLSGTQCFTSPNLFMQLVCPEVLHLRFFLRQYLSHHFSQVIFPSGHVAACNSENPVRIGAVSEMLSTAAAKSPAVTIGSTRMIPSQNRIYLLRIPLEPGKLQMTNYLR